jgi:hypothetical protein
MVLYIIGFITVTVIFHLLIHMLLTKDTPSPYEDIAYKRIRRKNVSM